MEREVEINGTYRHFKGGLYKVICIAIHTETNETLVVYKNIKSGVVFTRNIQMFLSKVDKEKYPDCTQKYRFELIVKAQ
jgi:hypothetical protein|nr:MAG TPA: Protein of unknown function (DUF1653) [Caudoviricetes sp.]